MYKLLLNGLLLNDQFTGVQYYCENLLNALRSLDCKGLQFEVILSNAYCGQLEESNNLSISKIKIDTRNRYKRILFENFMLRKYYRQNEFQLFHSPGYVLPYSWNAPSVLTVHDIIALEHPEFCQDESVVYFKLFLPRSIKKATKIIAVSNKVKEDILKRFAIPPEKIEVIYHGVADCYSEIVPVEELIRIKKQYHLPERYILFVGNIEPKKNLERLVLGFSWLKKNTGIPHKLVIAGKKGWKYEKLFETINKLQLSEELLFTGYVPEKDLPGIYKMASIFVFSSLDEGFGIPPLESMACGTPVLASNQGALPEVTGGNCLQVNPYDIEDIANGIYKLLTNDDLRNKSIEKGKEWVKNFTWERTAKETLKVYEDVLALRNVCKI
jgi:glycosyltransferase involved in cell wall biosynthesis